MLLEPELLEFRFWKADPSIALSLAWALDSPVVPSERQRRADVVVALRLAWTVFMLCRVTLASLQVSLSLLHLERQLVTADRHEEIGLSICEDAFPEVCSICAQATAGLSPMFELRFDTDWLIELTEDKDDPQVLAAA